MITPEWGRRRRGGVPFITYYRVLGDCHLVFTSTAIMAIFNLLFQGSPCNRTMHLHKGSPDNQYIIW